MTTNIRNNRRVEPPRSRFGITALLLISALVLTGGLFFAARQHFSSMDFGMKNSRLRKQVDQLEAEKRRLMLAREVSLSPTEIKKAVKKVAMGDSGRETVVAASAVTSGTAPTAPGRSLVAKTASVRPAAPSVAAVRGEKADKFSKKGADAE